MTDYKDYKLRFLNRRWIKFAVLALLILLMAGLASRNVIFGKPVDAYLVQRTDLTQTVVASGRVATPQRISVASEIVGRVEGVPVAEGQIVKRGQLLVQLENKDEIASVAQSRAAVMQAEARLRQVREVGLPAAAQSLRQAEANVEQARAQYERARDLQTKGFVSPAALDDARRNLDVAQSQVNSARLQVGTNGPTGSDSALAQAAAEQARANLLLAQVKLEQDAIKATADGTLIARAVEVGDVVQPGKELMLLATTGETQILVQIDEKNLAKLALGQHALGSADAFAGQTFPCEVMYINPGVDASRGSVEVKLRVPNPPAYLLQDMTVSVDIEIARRKSVLVIPTDAVHEPTGKAPWVMVIREGHATRQVVKPGLMGDGNLEILAGIAAGELVLPATNASIKAGDRVRPRPASKGRS